VEMRWAAKGKKEDYPHLTRGALRRLFGHHPEYRDMLRLATWQREFAQYEYDILLPSGAELLAWALSHTLKAYFMWVEARRTWHFSADEEHLTPGTLTVEAVEEVFPYQTLGDWLDEELSGRWRKDREAPTGMVPETMGDVLRKGLRKLWAETVRATNWKPDVKGLAADLKEEDKPVWLLMQHVQEIIGSYPLPMS